MSFRKAITGLAGSALLAGVLATPAIAVERWVEIINDTRFTILEFYGSNIASDSWEENILDFDVIPSGTTMRINFNDGSGYCMFDFKAVFDDGAILVRKRVNTCELDSYTYK